MFENRESQFQGTGDSNEDRIQNIKDQLMSLSYRLQTLQSNLTDKIDRKECMTMLQRKLNSSHLKKITDQLLSKIAVDKQREHASQRKKAEEQTIKINSLMTKLKKVHRDKDKDKESMKSMHPQELYLESNETMFGMLVEEINGLRLTSKNVGEEMEVRHKKNINLNNQVFLKLDKMEHQIEATIQYVSSLKTVINSEKKSKKFYESPQTPYAPKATNNPNQVYQGIRFQILGKSVESIQKDLSTKLNIKDIMPIIRQNLTQFEQEIRAVKTYAQESIESTRKILLHQSQINQEICTAVKVGCWQAFETHRGYIAWNRQLYNMVPQNFEWHKNTTQLKVVTQGLYLLKVYCLDSRDRTEFEVEINEEVISVEKQQVVKVPQLSVLKIRGKVEQEVVIYVQKL